MGSFDNTWERIHSTTEWGQYPSESVIRFVARNFYKAPDRKNIKLLDFGCGGGAHTWYLLREGFDVYAFDGSKSAVENTREKLIREFGTCQADLRVRDATELDYEDSFFDGIIDNFCIYANKLEDIEHMYSECYRVLKHGGKIYSACFGYQTTGYQSGIELEENTYKDIVGGRLEGRGTVHFFNENDLSEMLKNIGFKDIHTDYDIYSDSGSIIHILSTIAGK